MVQRHFGGATEVQEVQMTTENGFILNDFSAKQVQYWCNNSIGVSATSPIYIGEVLALIALALTEIDFSPINCVQRHTAKSALCSIICNKDDNNEL